MSTPDSFLVIWWLLTASVGIAMFILVRRPRRLNRHGQRAVLAHLRGIPLSQYPALPDEPVPGPTKFAIVLSIAFLVVGWLVLIVLHDWTRLWVLNLQIFGVLFGAGMAWGGLSAKMPMIAEDGTEDWISKKMPRLTRTVIVLFGIAFVVFAGTAAIRDLALPSLVIEGHVDSVRIDRGEFSESVYVVVIDGKQYKATFEAFEHIHPGRRVRAEIGAGSGMIFAADDNALRPVERPRRN